MSGRRIALCGVVVGTAGAVVAGLVALWVAWEQTQTKYRRQP